MGIIKKAFFGRVQRLYLNNGCSAREIAEKFGVTLDAVYYFLKKYRIQRRSPREQNELRFKNKRPSFNLKKRLNHRETRLKLLGVVLYWCEGATWAGGAIVDFANSNPAMIDFFMQFLRQVCGIDEKRLRIYLYCYANQKPRELIKFWSQLTKIPRIQFTKPYIRSDFRLEKQNKMPYGLVHIRYGDKKLLLIIKKWIQELQTKFRVGSEVVKRTTL